MLYKSLQLLLAELFEIEMNIIDLQELEIR